MCPTVTSEGSKTPLIFIDVGVKLKKCCPGPRRLLLTVTSLPKIKDRAITHAYIQHATGVVKRAFKPYLGQNHIWPPERPDVNSIWTLLSGSF